MSNNWLPWSSNPDVWSGSQYGWDMYLFTPGKATLEFSPDIWQDEPATWTTGVGTWADYGKAPIVKQTFYFDPVTGVLTLTGGEVNSYWRDPQYRPTIWVI